MTKTPPSGTKGGGGGASSHISEALQMWKAKDREGQTISATKLRAWGSRKVGDSGVLVNA